MKALSEHTCTCNKCELMSNNKVLIAKGAKTEYRIINENERLIDKYVVDDCLLRTKQKDEKCDYLVLINEIKEAYFVECKGSDVLKAVNQLDSSINILRNNLPGYVLKGRIISTRVYSPDLRMQAYKRLREKLKGQLETRNIVFIELIK